MTTFTLGIDIGGTSAKYGAVAEDGTILMEDRFSTTEHTEAHAFFNDFFAEIREKLSHFTDHKLTGVGIGAPNANYYEGTISHAPNLKWGKGVVAVRSLCEDAFNVPVAITNDANAAALGEMVYGKAKDKKHFIMITLGTGVGAGVVIDGKLLYGHDGFAGELGHMEVVPGGRVCGTGHRGCLEVYSSATGIKRTVFELLADSIEDSQLRTFNYHDLSARDIYEAALKDDPIALQAFDITARILGHALADFVAFSSPEAIYIFGGLMNAGNMLLAPIKKYYDDKVMEVFRGKVSIEISGLMERSAAILGASALIRKEMEK